MYLLNPELAATSSPLPIIDIRRKKLESTLGADIHAMLNPGPGKEKKLPTLLLYDEQGLKLFEDITYLEEYYPTEAEIEVLTAHADKIAARVQEKSLVVELGSGNLRKVKILLDAFERAKKPITYYALDLSRPELERTLRAVQDAYVYVQCGGLHGTYDDGLAWLKKPENAHMPKAIVWLGSSIGNFDRLAAATFLKEFSTVLQPNQKDIMIIGVDACNDSSKVYSAYNDREGKTHEFILNGLVHANRIMGKNLFDIADWQVIGEYDVQAERHQAFVSPKKDVHVCDTIVRAGERVRIEESYKFNYMRRAALWTDAEFLPCARFANATDDYHLHIVSKHPFKFTTSPSSYAASPVPRMSDWEKLWAAWDTVTLKMIPHEEMLSKPIQLRNACIFYVGHIPAFLDIHLTRALGEPATEPASYHAIFERGIDPDVDNPENCHAHSEVPAEWPSLTELLAYQQRVRSRVQKVYERPDLRENQRLARASWLGFEHEALHLETLLYMLLQSDKTLAPTAVTPDFASMAVAARLDATSKLPKWVPVPATELSVGINDEENEKGPERFFGWDNEKPHRTVSVASFESKAGPITNEEYATYLRETHQKIVPASWVVNAPVTAGAKDSSDGVNGSQAHGNDLKHHHTNGNSFSSHGKVQTQSQYLEDKFVRTVYGLVPLAHALDWPVCASYDELAGCAQWIGGRIPTADEVRSIYDYAEHGRRGDKADSILTRKVSAVNGHLSNEGVEISPPSASGLESATNGHQNGSATNGTSNGHPDKQEPHSGASNGHVNGTSSHKKSGEDSLNELRQSVFADLAGCNIGFQHFHPTAAHPRRHRADSSSSNTNGTAAPAICGRGQFGGLWEWTSTPLAAHAGFKPGKLYPAYSQDFFDGKHNVVLGGSWATHPRIAGRKSFVNWYQRNYPYAWCGARVVRDTPSA